MPPKLGLLPGEDHLHLLPDGLGEPVALLHEFPPLDPVGHPGDEAHVVDVVLVVADAALPALADDVPYAAPYAPTYRQGIRGDNLRHINVLVRYGVELLDPLQPEEVGVAHEPLVLPKFLRGLLRDTVGEVPSVVVPEVYLLGLGLVEAEEGLLGLTVVTGGEEIRRGEVLRRHPPSGLYDLPAVDP